MAKLADAADLKSAGLYRPWGFKSPSGHQYCEVPRLSSGFRRRAQTPATRLKCVSGYHLINNLRKDCQNRRSQSLASVILLELLMHLTFSTRREDAQKRVAKGRRTL